MPAKEEIVYLGLGSNLGNRKKNLQQALRLLAERMNLGKVSSIYETEPVGNVEQPRFLNMVCQVATGLSPHELLHLTKEIEQKLGRTGKTGEPRPIDIDILLYGELVINSPELVIPHPRMTERFFVLVPLAEIAPEQLHPASGRTIREILQSKEPINGVFKCNEEVNCTR